MSDKSQCAVGRDGEDDTVVVQQKKANEQSPAHQAKEHALQRLNFSFHELTDSLTKVKQCVQAYKTKSFFFPHAEFTKPFTEQLKQVENDIQTMGSLLHKEVGDKCDGKNITSPSLNETDIPRLPAHTPDHSDIPCKTNGVGSITPPASEVGNDEILCTSLDTSNSGSKKRRRRGSLESSSVSSSVKRPRRTLIDSYLSKKEDGESTKAKEEKDEEDDDDEDEEFEVQSIIDMKKSQGQLLYHVTWKGYSPDDSTWEPSSNLTSCEDLIVEFFKEKLKLRNQENPKMEELGFSLHYDPSIKDAIRKAVYEYFCVTNKTEYENAIHHLFSSKVPAQPHKDPFDLIEKAITARKRERYLKHVKLILEDKAARDLKEKRDIQLAELRKWERKINSICSDPAKLCVENNVDLEMPPMEFVYINDCRAGEGVTLPCDPLIGCECDDCSTSKKCCAYQMSSWTPYTKAGRVKVSLGTPIYECNKRCSCGPDCSNRVVQKGRTLSLCIFRTANGRGWGVKAMENIKKDSLVTEYVGEVITSEEAEKRGKGYDAQRCTYLFDLDYNKGDQNPYTVDAAKYGNVSHFINHSCDPNLVVYNVWVNCLDPDLPRLALFATQDIKKGEELTFDYNSGLDETTALKEEKGDGFHTPEKGKDTQEVQSELYMKTPKGNRGLQYGKTQCRCGAPNCRQYFF